MIVRNSTIESRCIAPYVSVYAVLSCCYYHRTGKRGAIKELPRHVDDNSDCVLTARLEDNDIRVLLFKLETKIGDEVAGSKSEILKMQDKVALHGVMTHLKSSSGRHLNRLLE